MQQINLILITDCTKYNFTTAALVEGGKLDRELH